MAKRMTVRNYAKTYVQQTPSLEDSLRLAEYTKLEALFLISKNVIADRERMGLNNHVLRQKYKCGHHEYNYALWIGKSNRGITELFDEFLESEFPTVKQFLEHKVYGYNIKKVSVKMENLDKAWKIISAEAKKLYDAEDTKREAYLILEQIRTRLNNFMPINCELSDFDWFISQDCCCCGKEPIPPYGNHIIKILTGIPVTMCPRCKQIWDSTHDEDMIDKDMVLKALWRYTKGLEQTLNIING
jgi:hypothetical protein